MFTKTSLIALSVISLLSVGGIGYAIFTSTVTLTGNAAAGSPSLAIIPIQSLGVVPKATNVGMCGGAPGYSSSNGPNPSISFSTGPLAPGDTCDYVATINNNGNLPVNGLAYTGLGTYNSYFDVGVGPSDTCHAASLAVGANCFFDVFVDLNSAAPNSWEGASSGAIAVTLTGSP